MNISVIGCGRWGSFIAWYLNRIGHQVKLYGRSGSVKLEALRATRKNGIIELQPEIDLTDDLRAALQADMIFVSIHSQGFRGLCQTIAEYPVDGKLFVLCMKGLEIETGKRLTEIMEEELEMGDRCAVWLGPGHVQEFYQGVPNCMVIDSADEGVKETVIQHISSDLIRFYYGKDLIGNEVGAAAKNVIGIAGGMLDGLGLSSLKGALMSRGTREISRLIKLMNGNEMSAYGLCHLGDYEATLFSEHSHNRQYGENLVKRVPYNKLAEGCYTVKALQLLAERQYTTLPICKAVYDVIYEGSDAGQTLEHLFSRTLKEEF